MTNKEYESLLVLSVREWRDWLERNHAEKQSIWLIQYKKHSGMPSVSWSEAVDEALCFGWIDSTKRPIDEEKYMQYYGKRKANSTWSKVNKEKVKKLIAEGRMSSAGLESIKIAKQNGTWSLMDSVEALVIPDDLEEAFKTRPGSRDFFLGLSKSAKKSILHWLMMAKRPETRQKRIKETVESAGQNLKPKPLR